MTSLVCRVLDRAKSIMLDLKYVNNAEDRAIFLTDIEKLKKVDFSCNQFNDMSHINVSPSCRASVVNSFNSNF
jgi:hypothetical protein